MILSTEISTLSLAAAIGSTTSYQNHIPFHKHTSFIQLPPCLPFRCSTAPLCGTPPLPSPQSTSLWSSVPRTVSSSTTPWWLSRVNLHTRREWSCARTHTNSTYQIAKGLGNHSVSPRNFPLPTLEGRLINLSETLHGGRGFFIVSGLNIDDYSVEDSVTVYLGLASYIGDQHGIQNSKGDVLSKYKLLSEKSRKTNSVCSARHRLQAVDRPEGREAWYPLE